MEWFLYERVKRSTKLYFMYYSCSIRIQVLHFSLHCKDFCFFVFCVFCLFLLEFSIILVVVLYNICVIIVYIGFKCSGISFWTIKLLVLTFCEYRRIMLEKTCFQRGFEFFKNISYLEKRGRSIKSWRFNKYVRYSWNNRKAWCWNFRISIALLF